MSTTKVYRWAPGCIICSQKSSSSRFVNGQRYQRMYLRCFGPRSLDRRGGKICNTCVLLIKRYLKMKSKSNSNYVDPATCFWPWQVDKGKNKNNRTLSREERTEMIDDALAEMDRRNLRHNPDEDDISEDGDADGHASTAQIDTPRKKPGIQMSHKGKILDYIDEWDNMETPRSLRRKRKRKQRMAEVTVVAEVSEVTVVAEVSEVTVVSEVSEVTVVAEVKAGRGSKTERKMKHPKRVVDASGKEGHSIDFNDVYIEKEGYKRMTDCCGTYWVDPRSGLFHFDSQNTKPCASACDGMYKKNFGAEARVPENGTPVAADSDESAFPSLNRRNKTGATSSSSATTIGVDIYMTAGPASAFSTNPEGHPISSSASSDEGFSSSNSATSGTPPPPPVTPPIIEEQNHAKPAPMAVGM